MASEQTQQTQPPASLAPSDLTASQREEQVEWEPAHWPDTLLWPPRYAAGHRGTQRDAERCRAIQSDAEGTAVSRRRRVLTGNRHSTGWPPREKGHSRQRDTCSCHRPELTPSVWWRFKPWERAGRNFCTGKMFTCSARRKPSLTNLCPH